MRALVMTSVVLRHIRNCLCIIIIIILLIIIVIIIIIIIVIPFRSAEYINILQSCKSGRSVVVISMKMFEV